MTDQKRLRRIAKRDFRFIFGPNERIPRGRLLDEFAHTFGARQFDGMKWHRYAVRHEKVIPIEDEKLATIAREHGITKKLVQEIRKAIST
jgi:hypothetical protein